ncbi:unnamed protein product [marine sediment metagenome]|uniref:Uncharacterized protein n=1 Tax=marine sediment metagenome TaxID=412755 RepID=X1TMI5_9ZZZZ
MTGEPSQLPPGVEEAWDRADGSVLGTAEPPMKFKYFGEDGSWASIHAPEGIDVVVGPGMFILGASVSVTTIIAVLSFLGKRYTPEQYITARDAILEILPSGGNRESISFKDIVLGGLL